MNLLQSHNYEPTNQKHLSAHLTVGTNIFFVNTNIIEHQHVDVVKSPFLRIIENTKQVLDVNF